VQPRGRLGELGNGRGVTVADDVVAAGRVVLDHAPEEIGEIRDVDRGQVLLPRASMIRNGPVWVAHQARDCRSVEELNHGRGGVAAPR
jgi:hypothetical protein